MWIRGGDDGVCTPLLSRNEDVKFGKEEDRVRALVFRNHRDKCSDASVQNLFNLTV